MIGTWPVVSAEDVGGGVMLVRYKNGVSQGVRRADYDRLTAKAAGK